MNMDTKIVFTFKKIELFVVPHLESASLTRFTLGLVIGFASFVAVLVVIMAVRSYVSVKSPKRTSGYVRQTI